MTGPMSRPRGDRTFFLRRSAEIELVKRQGRRVQTPLFNLQARRADGGPTRVGIVAGKRLGGAVARNRVKRRFRELARTVRPRLACGYEMLVFPRREAVTARPAILRDLWLSVLGREGLLVSESDRPCGGSA